MKRFVLALLIICAYSFTYAQKLTIKSVNLRPQDARAASMSRTDSNGKKCAIIRVGVVGIDDLVFPDAVGEVEHTLSEYVVYVSDGLKSLRYKNNAGQDLGTVVFDDFGLDINSLASYDVVFDSENHLRSAIFSIQPKEAKLTFDGKRVEINKDGFAMINRPVGKYSYVIEANGYIGNRGEIELTEDDISTVKNIFLEERLFPVTINVFPNNATVFIDNIPYSKEAINDLRLAEGEHTFRVTAENYEDAERTIDVKSNLAPIYFALKESKQEIVKHKEERSRTNISIRNAIYITGGFSMMGMKDPAALFKSDNAYDFTAEISWMQHFGGILAAREGVSFSVLKPNRNENYYDKTIRNDSTHLMTHLDVPLQIGVSIPFGTYNRHLFTILAGGYGSYLWLQDEWRESAIKEEDKDLPQVEKNADYWDYGIRLSAKLDIGHFTIGADFSQSLNKMGFSAGINVGVKLYSLKKN